MLHSAQHVLFWLLHVLVDTVHVLPKHSKLKISSLVQKLVSTFYLHSTLPITKKICGDFASLYAAFH